MAEIQLYAPMAGTQLFNTIVWTQLQLLNIMVGPQLQLSAIEADNPWPKVNSQLSLFQNLQILRTITSRHDIIHTPGPISYLGFIMTIVIVISFCARA